MGGDGSAATASSTSSNVASSLQLLLTQGIGQSVDDQLAFLSEQLVNLQAQVDNNETNPADEEQLVPPAPAPVSSPAPPPRRQSRRSSVDTTASIKQQSKGPPVDALRIDFNRIKEDAQRKGKPSAFLAGLDFIHLSDDHLNSIFVTDRSKKRLGNGAITFPPRHYRRTATQLRQWFNNSTKDERTKIFGEVDQFEIIIDHNALLEYDAATSKWVDSSKLPVQKAKSPVKPPPKKVAECPGITLGHIRAIKWKDEARSEQMIKGFKYTVRDGWTARAAKSNPNDDQWQYCPPVNGCILNQSNSGKADMYTANDLIAPIEKDFDRPNKKIKTA